MELEALLLIVGLVLAAAIFGWYLLTSFPVSFGGAASQAASIADSTEMMRAVEDQNHYTRAVYDSLCRTSAFSDMMRPDGVVAVDLPPPRRAPTCDGCGAVVLSDACGYCLRPHHHHHT